MPRKKTDSIVTDPPAEEFASAPPQPDVKPKTRRTSAKATSAVPLPKRAAKAAGGETAEPATRKSRSPKSTEQTAVEEAKPKRTRKRADPDTIVDEAGFFVVLEWRAVSAGVVRSAAADAPLAQRKTRRRRRSAGESTPDALAEDQPIDIEFSFRSKGAERRGAPAETPMPEVPVRPAIPIPEDAPVVAVLHGVPTIVKNQRAFPPLLFFGNSSDERRAETVQEEIRVAGSNGIHIHTHLLDFEVSEDAVEGSTQLAAYLLAQTLQSDPEAHVMYRVVFLPPRNWEATYVNAVYTTLEGARAEPSICDDEFWATATRCLERFVKSMRLAPNGDRVLGLHLDRAEWFAPEGRGPDTSNSALWKFRDWARTRYSNDKVSIRAAWFDGRADFDTIQIPDVDKHGSSDSFMRASRKDRRFVDYHLFLSDATAGRIGDLAYAVKAASEGYYLVGVSYGYTFEWSHPGSGHLALGKLARTREVDIIAGPPSYRSREAGGSAPFPCPIDSLALNGKLFISEEDFKTTLGTDQHEPDDYNPVIKTPQALDSMHWRGAGAALAHASGVSWMDLWGNGWLKTASIWKRGANIANALSRRLGTEHRDPDVAVFIDERALAYLVDASAFAFLVQNVHESVLRSGLSAGFFLVSDLAYREQFPDAKLYLFLNAWDIRPELRSAIKNRLQRDNKVLFWLYAAGLFEGGRDSLERAREVTGIALKPQPFHSKSGTTVLNKRHPLCSAFPDRGVIGGTKLEPSYFAIPEDAIVLGEYTQTGLPSFVVKQFGGGDPEASWTSVFLGEPIVSPALIRALGQMAGAHVYDFHEDVVHVRPPFLTVHCGPPGPRTITLPPNWSAFDLQTSTYESAEGNSLRFTAIEGSTKAFLIGARAELESLLHIPIEDLLHVETLPESPANLRSDDADFDIPIMKLGEFMEGDLAEENLDDWLLRPALVEEIEETTRDDSDPHSGRRRRRRRGRGGTERGTEEVVIATEPDAPDDEGFEMHVTFRKRD